MLNIPEIKNKAIWNFVLTISFLAGFLYLIFYGHSYEKMPQKILAIIASMSPVLLFLINVKTSAGKNIFFLVVFLVFFAITLSLASEYYKDYQLSKYAIHTKGLVVELKGEQARGRIEYSAIVEYKIGNLVYKQSISNNDYKLKQGDILDITASNKDPELFRFHIK
ncbi:MAG: hypothetical protein J0M08_06535 [Bacteroidetes bacterium]|nr:hypothetical protein [Bacteroidota bacterium]